MNKRFAVAVLAALGSLAALAPTAAQAANVGHYELCSGQGETYLANAITAGGDTPVSITVPDATQLAGVTALLVTNCSNGGYGAEWTANLAAIDARVQAGMSLIFYDRAVTGANAQLPGGGGLVAIRDFSDPANIDLPATSPLLNTNGGPLTQTTLDGGTSSSHGYVAAASLPAGGVVWAHRTAPAEGVIVAYPRGAGKVVYSTIPGDYYLNGSGSSSIAAGIVAATAAMVDLQVYTFTTCAAEGFTGIKLTLCKQICEVPQSPATLAALIKTYMAAFREEPPCAR